MTASYPNYHPLKSDDEIRILTLLPGNFDDGDVQVTLDNARLDGAVPAFDAVSYVWSDESEYDTDTGDAAPPQVLLVESQTVAVKANLYALLLHFRHSTEVRRLWVDALCINQADIREREQQVKLMTRIYSEARSTLMWVGMLARFGDCANTLLRDLMGWETPNLSTREYREYRETANPSADDGWMGLIALLHRAYWKRVWIVQEVLISRNPVLCFGKYCIPYRSFSSLVQRLADDGVLFKDITREFQLVILSLVRDASIWEGYILDWPPKRMTQDASQYADWLLREAGGRNVLLDWVYNPPGGTALAAAELCKLDSKYHRSSSISLLEALLEARIRDSTETLDRVYAMLGLTPEPRLAVNYRITTNELYAQVATDIIAKSGSLDILSACVKFRRHGNAAIRDEEEGLPSWVPDWRSYQPANGGYLLFGRIPCVRFSASGPSTPKVQTYKDGSHDVLRVSGRRLSHVTFTSTESTDRPPPASDDDIFEQMQDTWTYWSLFVQRKLATAKRLRRSEKLRRRFRRPSEIEKLNPSSAIYGGDMKQRVAWGSTHNLGVCKDHPADDPEAYYQCPAPGPDVCPNAECEFEAYDRLRFACPKFFILKTGHMGRGPYSLKEGDIVVILCGGKVPFALRQDGNTFLLLGECSSQMEQIRLEPMTQDEEVQEDIAQPVHPPIDGGRDAWLVMTACAVLEALVWGFPFAFGVFHQYYAELDQFSKDKHKLATIGTTATGVMYITAPLVYWLLRRYPRQRKRISILGFGVAMASLVGASFASSVAQLQATQGVLYAVGGSLHYFPTYLYLDEWFVKRRGLAYGVFIAGGGAAGVVVPFLMEWVLHTWGFRTALRAWVVISVIITAPAMFWLKTHPLGDQSRRPEAKYGWGFLRSPALWILSAGNFVHSLGYFMPLLYLPSFATSQGWTPLTGTIAVSMCNGANVLGATFVGWLVDRYHVTTAINFCTLGTVLSVLLFWSFATNQPLLYVFAFAYGLFAGGFSATWSGCSNSVRRTHPVETGLVIALLTAGKGVGSVISGPLSGALVSSDEWKSRLGFAYGSGYGSLIVFSGVTASFAGVGWLGKRLGLV